MFRIIQPDLTQKSYTFSCAKRGNIGLFDRSTSVFVLFCLFPVLKPYCWACHDSELQIVTLGAWKSSTLCSHISIWWMPLVTIQATVDLQEAKMWATLMLKTLTFPFSPFSSCMFTTFLTLIVFPLLDIFLFCFYANFLIFHYNNDNNQP